MFVRNMCCTAWFPCDFLPYKPQRRRAIPWFPQAALHQSSRRSRRNWWPWHREAARMALLAYGNRRQRRVDEWSEDSMKTFQDPRIFPGWLMLFWGCDTISLYYSRQASNVFSLRSRLDCQLRGCNRLKNKLEP